jgi:hypothetical protein
LSTQQSRYYTGLSAPTEGGLFQNKTGKKKEEEEKIVFERKRMKRYRK